MRKPKPPFFIVKLKNENCVRKYDFISALAKETAAEVVKNREEWMKYLIVMPIRCQIERHRYL